MVFAEEIRNTILRLAEEHGRERSFAPSDVARAIDDQHWHRLLDQVTLVANAMVKEGKIEATRPIQKNESGVADAVRFKKST